MMLRIALTADVHYPDPARFHALYRLLTVERPDVLVVAGDLVSYSSLEEVSRLLSKIRKWFDGVIIGVAGNHEHWLTKGERRRGLTSVEKIEGLAEVYASHGGVLLDVDGPYCLDSICFAGVTGWYDYSYAVHLGFDRIFFDACNPWGCSLTELEACERGGVCTCPDWFRDCLLVKLGMSNAEYALMNAERLRVQLSKIAGRKTIVVLHHAPRRELLRYTGDRRRDFYFAYAGHEKLDEVIRSASAEIVRVVYGHLHERSVDWIVELNGVTYVNAYNYTLIEV